MTDFDELVVPASAEERCALEDRLANDARYTSAWATNTERALWRQQAAQLRAIERQQADERPVSVEALAEKFDWSPALLWHLVQPYCRCEMAEGGWVWCRHAADEGIDTRPSTG